MSKLLVCIDGSVYAENLCLHAAWAAQILDAEIDLLHVLPRNLEQQSSKDTVDSIGLGARSGLLDQLSQVDVERSQLDKKKCEIILKYGVKVLENAGVKKVNTIAYQGSLDEAIRSLENSVEIVFMGKRGEDANVNSVFLGANLEKSARAVTKPLFVTSSIMRPMSRFLIAYDGKGIVEKAINYVVNSPLLKGMECHLLAVSSSKDKVDLSAVEQELTDAGFKVVPKVEQGDHVDEVLSSYIEKSDINLLIAGAYSHSRIRNLLLGSTTASLIKTCKIPLLLFR